MSVTILGPLAQGGIKLPFYSFKVPAGFPSPAADHIAWLVQGVISTFPKPVPGPRPWKAKLPLGDIWKRFH